MIYFCHFHGPRLAQFKCLVESIRKFDTTSKIVAVVDPEAEELLRPDVEFRNSQLVFGYSMEFIEDQCRKMGIDFSVKRDALSPRDYAWTMQACLPACIMEAYNDESEFFYVDSDVYFYRALQPYLKDIPEDAFVGVCEHHYPPGKENQSAGRFNNGMMWWRSTPKSKLWAYGWARRSIDAYSVEGGYEQGELTNWPGVLGDGLHIFAKEINAGPWRIPRVYVNPEGDVMIRDGADFAWGLQSFHFHEFKPGVGRNLIRINGRHWNMTNYNVDPETRESIYEPYANRVAYHEAAIIGVPGAEHVKIIDQSTPDLSHE